MRVTLLYQYQSGWRRIWFKHHLYKGRIIITSGLNVFKQMAGPILPRSSDGFWANFHPSQELVRTRGWLAESHGESTESRLPETTRSTQPIQDSKRAGTIHDHV